MVKRFLLFFLFICMLSLLISPTISGSSVNALATSNNSSYKSGELGSNPKAPVPNIRLGIPNNAILQTNVYSEASQVVSMTAQGSTSWTELGPKPITNPTNIKTWGVAPFSGRVTAIVVNGSNPQNIYLGAAQGGVWKTVDGGLTWTPLTDNQPSLAVGALVISPDGKTLYAGTGEPNQSSDAYIGAGLLKSTDGGKSWTMLGSSVFKNAAISGIIVSQSNPTRLIVSTTRGLCCMGAYYYSVNAGLGVFVSSDGGGSWNRALSSSDTVGIADVVSDPTNPNVVWAGDFAGSTWRSADGGASWTQSLHYPQTSQQGRVALAMSPASGSTLFAAFANSTGGFIGLFQYQYPNPQAVALNNPPNGLTAFNQLYNMCRLGLGNAQCDYDLVLAVDPSNSNVIYIGGIELYRSSDGGQTWTDLGGYSATSSLHPDHHALTFSPSNPSTIFDGNDGGLWTSSNRGATWTNLNSGLSLTQLNSIAVSPSSNNVVIGGTQDNGCVKYSGSTSWSQIVSGDGGWTGFETSNSNIMYCLYTYLNFQKSVDGGSTWSDATTGINLNDKGLFYAPAFHPSVSCLIYIGGTHLYKTTDCASTWSDVSGPAFGSGVSITAIAASGSNIVYVGTSSGNVFISQDGGRTWQTAYSAGSSVTYRPISSIAVDPSNSTTTYFSVANYGIYKATSQNGLWQVVQLGAPTPSTNVIRIDPSSKWLYVGTDQGVYYSSDGGTSWALPGFGLPNVAVFDLAITASSQIIAATHGRGVWSITPAVIQKVTLTLSYAITGGGAGFSPPVLSYIQNGQRQTAVLGSAPSTFNVDMGSTWSVTNPLSGSSTAERWSTNQPTTGTLSVSQTLNFVYYHQFFVTVGYTTVGGGNPSSPSLSSTSFGSSLSQALGTAPTGVWVDNGATYTITNPLGGSTSTERWQASSATAGTISSAVTIAPTYYHQFEYTVSYSLIGGGTPTPPSLSYTSFGAQSSSVFSSAANAIWLDSGSSYSLPVSLSGSSQTERWQTTAAISGIATNSGALSPVYYHQYLISVMFSLIGGGTPTLPTFSYTSFGTSTSVTLVSQQQNFWADSGPFAATNPLAGSTFTERWYAPSVVNGTVAGPGSITLTYYHQFFLTIGSGNLPSQWYNSGSTAALSPQAVYGRASGIGSRIASYTIDGGAAVAVPPTLGTFNIQVVMNAPHTLNFNSVAQYEVTLDSGAKSSLNLITSPTISSDNYWYDAGSPVKVVLNGTWGRGSGSGDRLVSYTINGGAANSVASSGTVTVLSLSSIAAPQSIATTVTTQFQLNTQSGSVSLATPPAITGDAGWYDQGSSVKVEYNYVWNLTANQSRLNAIGYDVDGGTKNDLPRAGSGTFSVTATMDKAHTIDISSVAQYHFTVSGGFNTQLSAKSPTNDGFYDSGSATTATTEYTWNSIVGKSRENLLSYTLDGQTTNVTRAESGTFTTPSISFDRSHSLTFNSVTQYFITFGFTDNSGSTVVTPTNLQINLNGRVENVSGFRTWLDKGTTFTIASFIWGHVDVKPSNLTVYTVDMPSNEIIRGRIFDARLSVTDLLGVPISGASTQIILANGTQIAKSTDSNGLVTLRLIPLGTFTGSVSYLGSTTQFSGDASQRPVTEAKVFLSYPDLGAIGGGIATAVIAAVVKFVIRRPGKPALP